MKERETDREEMSSQSLLFQKNISQVSMMRVVFRNFYILGIINWIHGCIQSVEIFWYYVGNFHLPNKLTDFNCVSFCCELRAQHLKKKNKLADGLLWYDKDNSSWLICDENFKDGMEITNDIASCMMFYWLN